MHPVINEKMEDLKRLCEVYKVDALSLFGSMATDAYHDKSDFDFLVRFSNKIPLLDKADHFFDLKDELAQILSGDVDLLTEKSIKNPVLKKEIEQTKVDLL